jgi:hypothetical protein
MVVWCGWHYVLCTLRRCAVAMGDTEMNTYLASLVGKTFTHRVQPYGTRKFVIETVEAFARPDRGYSTREYGPFIHFEVSGTVIEGTETSRLFHHTSTRSIAGRRDVAQGVRAWELATLEKITVAM